MWYPFFRGVVWCSARRNRWRHKRFCHNVPASDPRHVVASLEAQGTMPVDAKERLWTGVCLRQTLLRLETVFDTSEVITSRLLAVPLTQLTPLCRARLSRCLLLRSCGLLWPGCWCSEDDPTRSDLVVSSIVALRTQCASAGPIHRCASP